MDRDVMWIAASVLVLGTLVVLLVAMTRRAAPPADHAPLTGDTVAQRIRRLEDELDDAHTQIAQLRDDVQYLLRQLEDR